MCKHPMPKGLRFEILQKTIRRQMDEYVRETGLTGTQVGVLGELGRLERESAGEVTQKALEAAAHVTHPTMTELLKKLEKKGFVSAKKEGKMNLYTPLVTQEEYQQQESRSVLEKLYGNSLKRFVNALYQGEKMKKEDIQELSDFLKEMEEDQEE